MFDRIAMNADSLQNLIKILGLDSSLLKRRIVQEDVDLFNRKTLALYVDKKMPRRRLINAS